MKRNSLTRRLVAGAVGLGIGLIGAVAFAAPAQAGHGHQAKQESSVQFEDDCEGTSVTLKSGTVFRNYQWSIDLENEEGVRTHQVAAGESFTQWIPADLGQITVTFDGAPNWGPYKNKWPVYHTWTKPQEGCDEPQDEPREPEAVYDLLPLVGCDKLVFVIRNNSEEGVDLTMSLTPSQDTTHGHAPGFIPLLDDEADENGLYEEPEDDALVDETDAGAGETVALGPFGPGESHAHGFIAVDGLTVIVEIAKIVDGKDPVVVETSELVWDTEGLGCEEGGEGGEQEEELPTTGVSTGLIALGALALLAIGGGLFLVARRRRVTFTA